MTRTEGPMGLFPRANSLMTVAGVFAVVAALITAASLAAAPPQRAARPAAPAPARPALVIVTNVDGTIARGQLVSADPRLTRGTWRLRDDVKRWRDIPTARGVYSVSEGHLGELVNLKAGGAPRKCPTCAGRTKGRLHDLRRVRRDRVRQVRVRRRDRGRR